MLYNNARFIPKHNDQLACAPHRLYDASYSCYIITHRIIERHTMYIYIIKCFIHKSYVYSLHISMIKKNCYEKKNRPRERSALKVFLVINFNTILMGLMIYWPSAWCVWFVFSKFYWYYIFKFCSSLLRQAPSCAERVIVRRWIKTIRSSTEVALTI